MKRYEKYKDSGIAWIGEIPEHWESSPIKHICINDRYAVKTGPFGTQLKGDDLLEQGDVRVYNQKNVIYNYFDTVKYFVTKEKAAYLRSFYTRPNDFLITSRGTIGRCAILPKDVEMGLLHPCLIALRIDSRQANTLFLRYYINETDCFKTDIQLKSNATTIEVIYTEPLKSVVLPLPAIDEQAKIVEYLDWKCGEVDKVVAVREEQIKLLGELRASIISRAVTKGLNPDAPLKDSGIAWIGEIPEHWEIGCIDNVSQVISGFAFKAENFSDNIGYYVVRIGDVKPTISLSNAKKILVDDITELGKFIIQKGDALMAMTGATIGKIGIYKNNEIALANQRTCIIRKNKLSCQSYLSYCTLTNIAKEYILLECSGSAQDNISAKQIGDLPIAFPTILEQQAIANYLDKKTAEIDSTIAKYKEQVEKLKEYRTALITEVVTGKIDVRDVVIPKNN